MKLHRFIGNFNLEMGDLRIKDVELINQLRNVLKLKVGEEIILCDGKMNEGVAEIKEYGRDFIEVNVETIGINQNEPDRHVTLYCAILKKENFELVVQKATEVGIKEIVPITSVRTVKLDIRRDRLEKIIKEAAEQSGRGIVPVLNEPLNIDKAIELAKNNDFNVFFDLSGLPVEGVSFSKPGRLDIAGKIGIWVGPEGGWDPQELELALKSDFKIINIGNLTLRAETAAIIGTYLAISGSESSR